MAKRKRLSPPDPDRVSPVLETKSGYPIGAPPPRSNAPISAVARETAAQAALEEVTEKVERARQEGRMIISVSHPQLRLNYLIRDRLPVMDDEMESLIESLRARGQQTPVEVTELSDGRYGLISGWRRCKALAHLYAETNDKRFAQVQAVIRHPEEASDAYLAMVEENEIRVGLSFYERALIVARTVERKVYPTEKQALQRLFASASRAKRSKIKSFLTVVSALDSALRYPQDLGERMGLQLAKAIEDRPRLADDLTAALAAADVQSAAEELMILQKVLTREKQSLNPPLETHSVTEILPGLTVKTAANGTVTLGGRAWTEDLKDRMLAWLKEQAG